MLSLCIYWKENDMKHQMCLEKGRNQMAAERWDMRVNPADVSFCCRHAWDTSWSFLSFTFCFHFFSYLFFFLSFFPVSFPHHSLSETPCLLLTPSVTLALLLHRGRGSNAGQELSPRWLKSARFQSDRSEGSDPRAAAGKGEGWRAFFVFLIWGMKAFWKDVKRDKHCAGCGRATEIIIIIKP